MDLRISQIFNDSGEIGHEDKVFHLGEGFSSSCLEHCIWCLLGLIKSADGII